MKKCVMAQMQQKSRSVSGCFWILACDSPPLFRDLGSSHLVAPPYLTKDHVLIAPGWQKRKESGITQMGDSVSVTHHCGWNSTTWPQLTSKEAGKDRLHACPGYITF